jgi:hypothetical protein
LIVVTDNTIKMIVPIGIFNPRRGPFGGPIVNEATKGNLKGIKQIFEGWFKSEDEKYLHRDAAIAGAFARRCGSSLASDPAEGHMEVIDWLLSKKYPLPFLEEGICTVDANMNEYLFRKGCPIPKYAGMDAAIEGYDEALEWLLSKKQPIAPTGSETVVCSETMSKGHLKCLKLLVAHGYKFSSVAIAEAAKNGHIHVLEWVWKQGYPRTELPAKYAAEAKRLDVFKWLVSYGFPWNKVDCKAHMKQIDDYIEHISKHAPPQVPQAPKESCLVTQLRREVVDLEARLKTALAQVETTRYLEQHQAKTSSELRTTIASLESNIVDKDATIAELRRVHATEMQGLAKTVESEKKARDLASYYELKVSELNKKIAENASNDRSRANDMKALRQSLASANTEAEKWKTHSERLQKEMQTCAAGFTTQMAEVQKNYAALEQELAALKATATATKLASITTELQTASRDKAALQVQVQKLTTDCSTLNVRLGDVTTCKDELKDLVATLKAQIADLSRPAKDMPLGDLLDKAIEYKAAAIAGKPNFKPIHPKLIANDDDVDLYAGKARRLRAKLENIVGSTKGVKSKLKGLPIDYDWLIEVHETMCEVLHDGWDYRGDFEWINNAMKMADFVAMY